MSEKITINFEVGPSLKSLVLMIFTALKRIDANPDERGDEVDRRILDLKGTEPLVYTTEQVDGHVLGVAESAPPLIDAVKSDTEVIPFVSSFNGLLCSLCNQPQFTSPSGITCANGCGGAEGVAPEKTEATTTTAVKPPPPSLIHGSDAANDVIISPPTTMGVELADGIPHDPRIHASTRTKYAKAPHGWKLKRGVDPALVATVTAELRGAQSIPAGGQQLPPQTAGAEKAFGTAAAAAVASNFPVVSRELPPPPPAAGPITTFAQLIVAVTTAKIEQPVIDAALAEIGLVSMALLGGREDLVPLVAAKLFPGV